MDNLSDNLSTCFTTKRRNTEELKMLKLIRNALIVSHLNGIEPMKTDMIYDDELRILFLANGMIVHWDDCHIGYFETVEDIEARPLVTNDEYQLKTVVLANHFQSIGGMEALHDFENIDAHKVYEALVAQVDGAALADFEECQKIAHDLVANFTY